MPRRVLMSLLLGFLCFTGCRSRSDLVEAELRTKDRQLRELKEELDRVKILNQAFEQQFVPYGVPADSGPVHAPSTSTATATPFARTLDLASGTGGVDQDRLPGDDLLVLVLVPKDEDGHPIKVVGNLVISAQEITPQGNKLPFGSWDVSASQLRPLWQQGLFSTGFQIKLGFPSPARQEKMRITVQMTLPDGRTLETDKDIRIRPGLPSLPQPKIPSIPPNRTIPDNGEILPPPEPIFDGPKLSSRRAELLPPRPARP